MIWERLSYFEPSEFEFPNKVDPGLLIRLDWARRIAGIPFVITSDFRPFWPKPSAHTLGKAVDVRVRDGKERMIVVQAALRAGFTRIGVYDKHVHLDVATPEDGFPQNVMWQGESQ